MMVDILFVKMGNKFKDMFLFFVFFFWNKKIPLRIVVVNVWMV